MTQPEFLAWIEFYKLYPFDDLHRIYRPAALVTRAMNGTDMNETLQWLQPDPATSGYSAAELATFKAFGVTPPARSA